MKASENETRKLTVSFTALKALYLARLCFFLSVACILVYWPEEDLVLLHTQNEIVGPPVLKVNGPCRVKIGKKIHAGIVGGIGKKLEMEELEETIFASDQRPTLSATSPTRPPLADLNGTQSKTPLITPRSRSKKRQQRVKATSSEKRKKLLQEPTSNILFISSHWEKKKNREHNPEQPSTSHPPSSTSPQQHSTSHPPSLTGHPSSSTSPTTLD